MGEEQRDYWDEQAKLPVRERERLWWAGAALPTALFVLVAAGWIAVAVLWLAD